MLKSTILKIQFHFCCLILSSIGIAFAAPAAESDNETHQTIVLRPYNNAYFRIDFDYRFDKAIPPFDEESGFQGKDIARGFIPTVPPTPFIRNLSSQELCLNSDHLEVFTSDSFEAYPSTRDEVGHVKFLDVPVSTVRGSLEIPYVINLSTYEDICSGWITIKSGWKGTFELDGETWILFVIDNLDGQIDDGDTFSIQKYQNGNWQRSSRTHSIPQTLFLEGRVFDLNFKFKAQSDEVVLEVTLMESRLPMGTLDMEANGIGSVYLQDKQTAVTLHSPAGKISVPAGQYQITDCLVKSVPDWAGRPRFSRMDSDVDVHPGQTTSLKIGLPLNHTVEMNRNKNLLTMTYQLRGVGGEVYTYYDDSGPGFEIYKGPVKLADGLFPYG